MSSSRRGGSHFGLRPADLAAAYGASFVFVLVGALVFLAEDGRLSPVIARLLRGNPDALGAKAFAALLVASGVGTALRASLAGVVVERERVVVRTSGFLGLPRVRTAYWAELRGATVHAGRIELVQFDGSSFVLPRTASPAACEAAVREQLGLFHVPIASAPNEA